MVHAVEIFILTDLSHVHLIFFFSLSQSSAPYSTVVHQLTLKLRRSTTVKDQDQQKPSVIRNNDIILKSSIWVKDDLITGNGEFPSETIYQK